jgi:hypothetical protein
MQPNLHRLIRPVDWQCQSEERGILGDYHVWLRNHGDKVVSRLNALVDALEGVPLTESKEMETVVCNKKTGDT